MLWALIPFLILSGIGSLFSIFFTAADHNISDGPKILAIFVKVIMLVWAIVLAVLFLSK